MTTHEYARRLLAESDRPMPGLGAGQCTVGFSSGSHPSPSWWTDQYVCVRCNKTYKERRPVYICGAMPLCPACGGTQSSWERGRS